MTGKRKREPDDAEATNKTDPVPDSDVAPSTTDPATGDTTAPVGHELLFCGSTKWSMLGRKSIPKLLSKRGGTDAGELIFGPRRVQIPSLPDVRFTRAVSGPTAAHAILLTTTGAAYGVGRNEHSQLGCAKPVAARAPLPLTPPLSTGETVVDATCARTTTLLRTSEGAVWAAGANTHSELGVGGRAIAHEWRRVGLRGAAVSVAAGAEFCIFVQKDGCVYASGSGQYGQLGNGRKEGALVTGNKLEFEQAEVPVQVDGFGGEGEPFAVKAACGANHALVLDDKGSVWSWGWGAYGRLGHRNNKDETRPRRIETFDTPGYTVSDITCGSSSSMAYVEKRKQLFYWGISKMAGESTMYPKPVHDLSGWEVRSFSMGLSSAVVAADRDVISWGGSPTFGELGYGEGKPKSSTKPKQIMDLEGVEVAQVAMGCAFTFMLVKENEARDAVQALDVVEFGET